MFFFCCKKAERSSQGDPRGCGRPACRTALFMSRGERTGEAGRKLQTNGRHRYLPIMRLFCNGAYLPDVQMSSHHLL